MKGDKQHNLIKEVLSQLVINNPMICAHFEDNSETVLGIYFNGNLVTFPSRIMTVDSVIDHCNHYMNQQNKKGRGPYKLIET